MLRFIIFFSSCLPAFSILFPAFQYLIFFAFIPFFYLINEKTFYRRLLNGFLSGMGYNLIVCYWIGKVSLTGLFILCSVNSFFWILFALLWGKIPGTINKALLWVSLEWLKDSLFTGFHFNSVSLSLAGNLIAIQMASMGGYLFITFWIILINLLIFKTLKNKTGSKLKHTIMILTIFLVPLIYGQLRIKKYEVVYDKSDVTATAGVIQPDIEPNVKWDYNAFEYQQDVIKKECLRFVSSKIDMLILPETVIIKDFRKSIKLSSFIKEIAQIVNCKILLGMPRVEEKSEISGEFNSIILTDANLNIDGFYDKINLVPFGEYIPFVKLLPKMKLLTPVEDVFNKGSKMNILSVGKLNFIPLICIEDSISPFVRKFAQGGADFIVCITNDGWFSGSYGPFIHDAAARFRSVENGLTLIRCANSGVSSQYSPYGSLIKRISDEEGNIENVRGVMNCDLKAFKIKTIYSVIGNYWILILFVLNLVFTMKFIKKS